MHRRSPSALTNAFLRSPARMSDPEITAMTTELLHDTKEKDEGVEETGQVTVTWSAAGRGRLGFQVPYLLSEFSFHYIPLVSTIRRPIVLYLNPDLNSSV